MRVFRPKKTCIKYSQKRDLNNILEKFIWYVTILLRSCLVDIVFLMFVFTQRVKFMKKNGLSLLIKGSALVLTVSLLPGCKITDLFKKKEAEKTESAEAKAASETLVLCSIDGKDVIKKGDFDKRVTQMLQANPYFRGAGAEMLPLNVKRKFLDRLVEEELFVIDADKQKIENDAEFQKALKEMVDLVTRSLKIQFREKKIYDETKIAEDQSKKYFEEHKAQYVKVAGGTLVSGVKFDSEAHASAFLAKAKANINDFEKLAKQEKTGKFREFGRVGQQEPANNGMGMEMVPAPIKESVLGLRNLPAVEKVKVGKEIWVVKASDKKDSVFFDFEEVKPQVEGMIKNNEFRTKLTSEIEKLKSEHKVTVNEEFFKDAQQPAAGQPAGAEQKPEEPAQAPQAA
jgi:hypothetical protein